MIGVYLLFAVAADSFVAILRLVLEHSKHLATIYFTSFARLGLRICGHLCLLFGDIAPKRGIL